MNQSHVADLLALHYLTRGLWTVSSKAIQDSTPFGQIDYVSMFLDGDGVDLDLGYGFWRDSQLQESVGSFVNHL